MAFSLHVISTKFECQCTAISWIHCISINFTSFNHSNRLKQRCSIFSAQIHQMSEIHERITVKWANGLSSVVNECTWQTKIGYTKTLKNRKFFVLFCFVSSRWVFALPQHYSSFDVFVRRLRLNFTLCSCHYYGCLFISLFYSISSGTFN